ncbi:hypothetical protein HPB51_024719 [Rhipicephalus microplus]|uniref:GRAM domain-containing protein n=1 Tax=Rhipicephalus microplus TaxID=6941 RepID=A0A9J6EVE2_RHIMP|nr:hypothetical protein HPB51_024719 [Rhipicephalus microplus]
MLPLIGLLKRKCLCKEALSFWCEMVIHIHRVTELSNPFFTLQRRKGHGTKGLSSVLVGTLDSVFDSKPAPYRILHSTPLSEVSYVVATSLSREEIFQNWTWIEQNLLETLRNFDSEDEATEFVCCKIRSLVAQREVSLLEVDQDNAQFRVNASRFASIFNLPPQEKLVNYYSCSFWKGRLPQQGWLYLSMQHLAFHSFLFGQTTRVLLRWTDITVNHRFYLHSSVISRCLKCHNAKLEGA